LPRHQIVFKHESPNDDKRIEMAFSKKENAADERKTWLRQFNKSIFLDQNVSAVSYSDFIDKELILFSQADCVRSIPHIMDGFKPGQRKVLYGCFKKRLTS
jgi:DNA topoisomerase-2